jgi:hypothetical protein
MRSQGMKGMSRASVLVVAAIAVPMLMGAAPQVGGEITSKNVRQAEAKAKSAEDHLKIAVYYENQAKLMQAKCAEAEDLVGYWSHEPAVRNNHSPNPYWSAKSRADALRAAEESASAHAAEQQQLAQSAR